MIKADIEAPRERPILFSAPMVRAIIAGQKVQTRRCAPIENLEFREHDGLVGWSVSFTKPIRGVHASHSGGPFSIEEANRIVAQDFCPYGRIGTRLWVKETWRPNIIHSHGMNACDCDAVSIKYAADGHSEDWEDVDLPEEWTMPKAAERGNVSPLFMPRWASRITLEITDVRLQHVQDISEEDSAAEGCKASSFPGPWWQGYRDFGDGRLIHQQAIGEHAPAWMIEPKKGAETKHLDRSAKEAFSALWDSINGRKPNYRPARLGEHGYPHRMVRDGWDESCAWAANPWVWALTFARV